jgi:hypothetical protein
MSLYIMTSSLNRKLMVEAADFSWMKPIPVAGVVLTGLGFQNTYSFFWTWPREWFSNSMDASEPYDASYQSKISGVLWIDVLYKFHVYFAPT